MAELNYLNGYLPPSEWGMELTRKGFAEALVELGAENPRVVVLDADLSQSTLTKHFAEAYPARFFECGIAEADMVNTAAGLAKSGYIPYLASYSIFLAGRAWDQIRNTVDYSFCNVKIAAAHGGISVGKDGATHQSMEDVANMQSLVNTALLLPSDYHEAKKATKGLASIVGPCYSRLGREKVPTMSSAATPWELGKAITVLDGPDGTLIGNGLMLSRCIQAAELLAAEGLRPRVLNMCTVKPLDTAAVVAAARDTGGVVVAEEASVYGGLGSTVARVVGESEHVAPVKCVAIRDMYLPSGDPAELMEIAGLTALACANALKDVLARGRKRGVGVG
jgi:transketolase